MARSMIQRRQDAEREHIETYLLTLRRAARQERVPANLHQAIRQAERGFEAFVIRDGEAWRPSLKTHDESRLQLAAARYLFARYPVPAPLERIWLSRQDLPAEEALERKRWFITVGQGGSLYRTHVKDWLSRKEVYRFLYPPGDLSFEEALWHAVARSYADDLGLALRIARSKIARTPRSQFTFWREAARFFCAYPMSLDEIDDFCDYLGACRNRDRRYSLAGRTPVSLRRQMQEWHRDIALAGRIDAAIARLGRPNGGHVPAGRRSWGGSMLTDWFFRPSSREALLGKEELMVLQLNCGADLIEEGRAMHHCVATYAELCIDGRTSIWSLRRKREDGIERLLTIELAKDNRVVQVRGFANRSATPEERMILQRWAKAKDVVLSR